MGEKLTRPAPAQHMTARGMFDKYKSLWGSWAIKHVPSGPSAGSTAPSVRPWSLSGAEHVLSPALTGC